MIWVSSSTVFEDWSYKPAHIVQPYGGPFSFVVFHIYFAYVIISITSSYRHRVQVIQWQIDTWEKLVCRFESCSELLSNCDTEIQLVRVLAEVGRPPRCDSLESQNSFYLELASSTYISFYPPYLIKVELVRAHEVWYFQPDVWGTKKYHTWFIGVTVSTGACQALGRSSTLLWTVN